MTTLLEQIDLLTNIVLSGGRGLDEALAALEHWLETASIPPEEYKAFSASLDDESTNDDRSLIASVLKLHAVRLFYRAEGRTESRSELASNSPYTQALDAFWQALGESEQAINEARTDIAIANAHQLLGDAHANRRWLDSALQRLPALATVNLVELARTVPPAPPPKIGIIKRMALALMGINLKKLARFGMEDRVVLAQMQTNQVVLMAHLLGISFMALRERQRARRAFRIAAHLIVRYEGMPNQSADNLLEIAETMWRFEAEAAQILVEQALRLDDTEHQARAQALVDEMKKGIITD